MNKNMKGVLCMISPKLTTKLMFYYNFKKKLNLEEPKDINEKLQWLKLNTYYNNPIITQCVDKLRVRDYLDERGFGSILPKLIGGGYIDAEEVRKHWNEYPGSFVIKCNHGCGYNILVKNKASENINDIVYQLNEWMDEAFWKIYCETQYRFVPHNILVEEYLGDDIKTYKFYCFNGEPRVCYVSSNGESVDGKQGVKDLYLDYFDLDWNWLDITLYPHLHKQEIERPKNFEGMKDIARELSKPFPFVRVDLYNIDGEIKFSELTFIPTGGNMKLKPEKTIDEWGEWLKLPT